MKISYNKLWKLLESKNMEKEELRELAEVSQSIMRRLSRNQPVTMHTMEKICLTLKCEISDVLEFMHDEVKEAWKP